MNKNMYLAAYKMHYFGKSAEKTGCRYKDCEYLNICKTSWLSVAYTVLSHCHHSCLTASHSLSFTVLKTAIS